MCKDRVKNDKGDLELENQKLHLFTYVNFLNFPAEFPHVHKSGILEMFLSFFTLSLLYAKNKLRKMFLLHI